MSQSASETDRPEDLSWRRYPILEKVFTEDLEGFLQRAANTCRDLDALVESDNPREAARAKAALAGYGKALELIQEIRAELENEDS